MGRRSVSEEEGAGTMSTGLTPMECRLCKRLLTPSSTELGRTAASFKDCFYQCGDCRVGYTNSRSAETRTLIYDSWERNIPPEVHSDLLSCIARSLNKRSRSNKLQRLSFESSEDAVTWTVFRYLQQQSLWKSVFGLENPRVFYWGAEFPSSSTNGPDIQRSLIDVLVGIGDSKSSLSEPDILLVTDSSIVTIEVKYYSPNSVQRRYRGFNAYLTAAPGIFRDTLQVADAGYYELTRNVVFTKLLADKLNCDWKVINLGMPHVATSAAKFAKGLTDPSRFESLIWPNLCRLISTPRVAWFDSYLRQKKLE